MSNIPLIVEVAPAPGVTDVITYEVPANVAALFSRLSAAKKVRESAEKEEREIKAEIYEVLPLDAVKASGKKLVVQADGKAVARIAFRTRKTVSLSALLATYPEAEGTDLISVSEFPVITNS